MHQIITEGKQLFEKAILALLDENGDVIKNMERNGNGELHIDGIALDPIPWFEQFSLSLRLRSDYDDEESRYNSGDWEYYDITSDSTHPDKIAACKFMVSVYEDDSRKPIDSAHLLFLAGAEALLSPAVAAKLQALGLDASMVAAAPMDGCFEYVVTDPDCSIKGNYCEFIIANRIKERLEAAG